MGYAINQAATDCRDDMQLQLWAYNTAFDELEMSFRFDAATLASLCALPGDEHARLCAFIAQHHSHLLTAYSSDFLCDVILEKKNEHYLKCAGQSGRLDPAMSYGATPAAQRPVEQGFGAHRH